MPAPAISPDRGCRSGGGGLSVPVLAGSASRLRDLLRRCLRDGDVRKRSRPMPEVKAGRQVEDDEPVDEMMVW